MAIAGALLGVWLCVFGVLVGNLIGVMAFGAGTTIVAPLSPDRARARAAIASLRPDAGATRYRAALARAAEEFASRRRVEEEPPDFDGGSAAASGVGNSGYGAAGCLHYGTGAVA